jgi:HEAT repeats
MPLSALLAILLLVQDPSLDPLVEQLRSDTADVREDAARRLQKWGAAALPVLKKALEDKDPEVAARCREILDRIRSDEAAAQFRKMEDALSRARTVRIKFKLESVTHGPQIENRTTHQGVLLLKQGNKVHLTGENSGRLMNFRYTMVSDGTRMLLRSSVQKEDREVETPEKLGAAVCRVTARSGPSSVFSIVTSKEANLEDTMDVIKLGEFKELPAEGATKKLSYRLMIENPAAITIRGTLSYDAASLRPLQRSLKITFGEDKGGEGNSTEVYEEYVLDAELPDGTFALPEEKK